MSSWLDIRYRSHDPLSARLSDLIQKQIDFETKDMEVTDEDKIEPIIPLESRMIMRDHLFRANLRHVATGQVAYLPKDPDGNEMRMWLWNEHGGRYLTDHSFMNNIVEIGGTDQSKIIDNTDDNGVSGTHNVNKFLNDEHLRVYDNPNIRIKEIAATAEGFTVFLRVYITFLSNESLTGRRAVLFSKLDTEQVDYGYAAHLSETGTIYFYVKHDNRERFISAVSAITGIETINTADFAYTDYAEEDFFTAISLTPQPPVIPYLDFAFTYTFATRRLQIIKNGTVIADSAAAPDPRNTGVVGWWRLQEAGDIGNQSEEPITYSRTVFNSIPTGNNGTITNALWYTLLHGEHEPYLKFDGNGDSVSITSYAGIQNLSSGTVSLWYRHDGDTSVSRVLARKGAATTSAWQIETTTGGVLQFSIWNNSSTRTNSTSAISLVAGNWYHVVGKWTMTTGASITVNGTKVIGTTPTGTIDTGSGNPLLIGNTTVNCAQGLIHDICVWNRQLSDGEVTSLYSYGHPHSGFPQFAGQPPPLGEVPDPIFVPFTQIYTVIQPATPEWKRLHKITASGFTSRYTGTDGTVIPPQSQPFTKVYDNPATGGTPIPEETIYDVSHSSSSHVELNADEGLMVGCQLTGGTDVGKIVTKVTPRGRKSGSPSGTVYCRHWSSSGSVKATIGSYAASSWATSDGDQPQFVNTSNTVPLAAGDVIGIEYGGGGTSDLLEVDQNDSDVDTQWDAVDSTGGGWGNTDIDTGEDVGMKIIAGGIGGEGGAEVKLMGGDEGCTDIGMYVPSTSSPIYDKKITRATFRLQRVGSPTGTLTCWIYKTGTDIALGASISISSIPTTPTDISFTNTNNGLDTGYALITGDVVAITISGYSTSSTNYLAAFTKTPSVVANVNERRYEDTQHPPFIGQSYAWVNYASNDVTGVLETGGFSIPQQDPWVNLDATTKRVAEKIATTSSTLYNKVITKISVKLKKIGAATGTITANIRSSADAVKGTLGTKQAEDISGTDFTAYEFQNLNQTATIANGDKICIEYTGTAIDYLQISMKKDATGANEIGSYYTTAWTDMAVWDLVGTIFDGGTPSDPLARTRVGEKIVNTNSTLKLSKISKFETVLRAVGNLPGNIYCRIRKGDNDSLGATIGQLPANTIPATGLPITTTTFTKEPVATYSTQIGDIVTIEYDEGDDANYLEMMVTTADTFGSTNSVLTEYNDVAYANSTTKDVVGNMWKDGYTIVPSVEEQPPPRDEYYTHDLLLFSGGYDWNLESNAMNPCNGICSDIRWYRKVMTTAELLNIYTNRIDRSNHVKGQIAYLGFFWLAPY